MNFSSGWSGRNRLCKKKARLCKVCIQKKYTKTVYLIHIHVYKEKVYMVLKAVLFHINPLPGIWVRYLLPEWHRKVKMKLNVFFYYYSYFQRRLVKSNLWPIQIIYFHNILKEIYYWDTNSIRVQFFSM